MSHYDVIVVGVGGMGSAACYQIAKRGQRVLGLEKFDLGHAFGSSHGQTRIIRLAYFAGDHYVPLLQRAVTLWQEAERDAGMQLYFRTGSLDIAPEGHEMVEGSIGSCRAHNLPHEILSQRDIKARFPAFHLPDGYCGNWQPDGGFIASERAIYAHTGLAMRHGAELRFNEPLLAWAPTAQGGVTVKTARSTYTAGQIVFTAGGWMPELIDAIAATGTRPMKQAIGWFTPKKPALFAMGRFPVFIITTTGETGEELSFYGFPLWEHPGFKLGGPHFGREPMEPNDPDRTPSARQVAYIRDCLRKHLPDADGEPMTLKGCIYTVTPDEHFIIDRLPGTPQALVLSPCSGHGFKFCSVFGEVAADLVTQGHSRLDITPFALDRFAAA
jgi:sarcosine oxidase